MCKKPSSEFIEDAQAYFRKGNEPAGTAFWFRMRATKCFCGTNWLVQMDGDRRWHQADIDPVVLEVDHA